MLSVLLMPPLTLLHLQLWSEDQAFPPLDLRGLSQLEDLLLLDPEDNAFEFWISFPSCLRSLNIVRGMMENDSWRSLSKCRDLSRLDCQVQELPEMRAEALPILQSLVLGVYMQESVLWAATIARRSITAELEFYTDPALLAQPHCHGMHLDSLLIDDQKPSAKVWQHLSIRRLFVDHFQGTQISGDVLPQGLEECTFSIFDGPSHVVVDLAECVALSKFCLRVYGKCQLELHGSFREEIFYTKWSTCAKCHRVDQRQIHWLGHKRCRTA